MYTIKPKKLLIINILDILTKYTDEDHRLNQKDFVEILEKEYSMKTDRRSVKNNLMNLIDFGYNIEYSESVRITTNKNGEKEELSVLSDFYLNRDFDDSELRLLIDSLLFSKHIPYSQCRNLIEKLEGLSSVYFKAKVKHISTFPDDKIDNKQLFYTIDIIDEAISKKRKISCHYLEYGTDKRLHKRRDASGNVREYILTPYQMAAKEGKYYLICNYDKYDDVSNYRLDRICDIKLLNEPAKPFEACADGKSLNLSQYMREHVYMFSSENERVKFRIVKPMISDIIDMFGEDVVFSEETEDFVNVTVNVNRMSMLQFAKSFAPDCIVLSPPSLADEVKRDLDRSIKIYEKMKG